MLTPQKLILNSIKKNFKRKALWVDQKYYTYKKLLNYAESIISLMNKKKSKVVAILIDKNIYCYSSILSLFLDNKVYVPLNNKFSDKKNLNILSTANVDTILYGEKYFNKIKTLKKKLNNKVNIIPIDKNILNNKFSSYNKLNISKLNEVSYILFTSGSTGNPKGVPIKNINLSSYIKNLKKRFTFNCNDKFSNNFDLTFDLSLHDIFISWTSGGCLYIPDSSYFFNPSVFIKKHKLTCWFSVPSLGLNMLKSKQLKNNNYPCLKYSAFCGEALPETLARNWQAAAPNSLVENLYGPTETTLAITGYRWNKNRSPKECKNGIVPIGKIFSGNKALKLKGDTYEFCVSGDQVFEGYIKDNIANKKKFIVQNKKNFYRTGDLVLENKFKTFFYLERLDRQIKVKGFRIEPQEIEEKIKEITSSNDVAVLGWPQISNSKYSYENLVAFIKNNTKVSNKSIINQLSSILSYNQIPNRLIRLREFKYNSNKKVDYNYFIKYLRNENR